MRGEGLVGGQDDGRALGLFDQLGHGERLAGAGGPQQHLIPVARQNAGGQLRDGGGLITGGLEGSVEHEGAAAFQLGAGQNLGAGIQRVGVVVRHRTLLSTTQVVNLIRFCSFTSGVVWKSPKPLPRPA